MGSIRRLMAGSDLQQLLEVAFAPIAVVHMLTGKSVSRAIPGHFLSDAVLNAMVPHIAFSYSLEIITEEQHQEQHVMDVGDNEDIKLALHLYDQVMTKDGDVAPDNLSTSPELHEEA